MVRLRIQEILIEKEKSKYWLCKKMQGMSYQNLLFIVTNKTNKISFDTLDKLSKALEVPVGDLFEQIEENTDNP
ncbi:MAG: helix-turn-helix transcriptional regulator [Lachnospiraceae bacterium]|nr:helix-turn-helix transcriptional regulator [Lachnospiraceae bacterium]